MPQEKFIPNAAGSQADLKSKVEIGKVYGGYFSNLEIAQQFCDVGIAPIEKELPRHVSYADFGGGEGFLAQNVAQYLISHGHETETLIADSNEKYLKIAKDDGLDTLLCNLEECNLPERDLITMRSVLHYNSEERQKEIMSRVYQNLKSGGFFVNSIPSGSLETLELGLKVINHPKLGRATTNNKLSLITIEEYQKLASGAGFSENTLAGYAQGTLAGPTEQWERFFGEQNKEAIVANDEALFRELTEKRDEYLREMNEVIEQYVQNDTKGTLGAEKLPDGNYTIRYQYPIFISRK